MSTPVPPAFPPPPPQGSLPPGKKPNVLLWILGGIVVLMLGVTAMCGLGGYFLMRKAKEAGFDTNLMKANPAYAAAKMAVTMSPDVEVVSSDDDHGTITVRDKKTGKQMVFKFDPDKKTMVVTDEDGKQASVRVTGEGDKGGVEVQGPDGSVKFGANSNGQMPSWVPVYPGSSPQGNFLSQSKEGSQSTFTFKTSDPAAKVMSYYQDQLKAGGFAINMATTTPQGGLIMAEDSGKSHSVMLTVAGNSDGTSVNVTAVEKK